MLGRPHQRGLLDSDHRGIFQKCFLILRGVLLHADAVARRKPDNFVVHVGDIHDVVHCVSALQQKPAQNVNRNESSEVANVTVIVDGRAAGVHADLMIDKRTELLDPRRQGIKKTKRHF